MAKQNRYSQSAREERSVQSKSKTRQKYPQQVKTEGVWFKRDLIPKTPGQEFYIETLDESTITICTGPAGCGKTWIVARIALERLAEGQVSRIVVTKPIVEAGEESLGFLPGDVSEKIGPHMVNILDAIEEHIGPTMTKKLVDLEKIVFVPAALLRGRDFKDAFILVDEAQNLTRKGLKLVMTRISAGSYMAINGDVEQSDLEDDKSGLNWVIERLRGRDENISVVQLTEADTQRHPLVSVITKFLN